MEWNKLMSTKRLGQPAANDKALPPRTDFTRDYDRIIFSSAFRRLQDKTQVFPLAKSDYVRTRLTHSLEVASVGRSLGILAGETILRNDALLADIVVPQEIGTVVATACLMHDIGNPPFGHAGESAIREWFHGFKTLLKDTGMNKAEEEDLLNFEGNAQGFRTLCVLQNQPQRGGLQLTSAVLGAFTKYPRASLVSSKQRLGISGKKFGFMQSDAELFRELADELALIPKLGLRHAWHRHPLAFLVEAADDICYHIMDVEDGFKAGVLTFEELQALHRPWLTPHQMEKANNIRDTQRRAEYFRAVTIDTMMREMIEVFDSNYDGLMDGSFDKELSKQIPRAGEFEEFTNLAETKVYRARPVVEIEACGFEVIGGLLEAFVNAIEVKATNVRAGKARSRTVLSLLPGGAASIEGKSPYDRVTVATDFVAGMTDSYAVELYQRIRGISLP